MIIIYVRYCKCAICWYFKNIVTKRKVDGMESFKINGA